MCVSVRGSVRVLKVRSVVNSPGQGRGAIDEWERKHTEMQET